MSRYSRSFALTACLLFCQPLVGMAADNPMEPVGIAHNRYLDCLRHHSDPTRDALVRTLFQRCGFAPGMTEDAFAAQFGELIEYQPDLVRLDRQWPLRDRFSSEEFEFIVAIEQRLRISSDAASADAALAQMEAQAIDRFDAGTRQGQAILAGLATARHSLRYWSTLAEQQGIPYAHIMPVPVADSVGTLIGTVMGGPDYGAGLGAVYSTIAAVVEMLEKYF